MNIIKYTAETHLDHGCEPHHFTVTSIKYASPQHYHDFYEFFCIFGGGTVHMVNEEKQHLTEGALVFIRPADVHFYDYDAHPDCQFINICYAAPTVHEVFHFLGPAFDPARLLEPKLPPYVVLTPLAKDRFIHKLEKIQVLAANDKPLARIQLKSVLVELLTQYFASAACDQQQKLPPWLESLLLQMQKKENFTEGITRLYQLSSYSQGHLNRIFKQYLHTTPVSYINELRLNYARYLLQSTNLSVIDVAAAAGFNNLSHFYHLFTDYYKLAPAKFRTHK